MFLRSPAKEIKISPTTCTQCRFGANETPFDALFSDFKFNHTICIISRSAPTTTKKYMNGTGHGGRLNLNGERQPERRSDDFDNWQRRFTKCVTTPKEKLAAKWKFFSVVAQIFGVYTNSTQTAIKTLTYIRDVLNWHQCTRIGLAANTKSREMSRQMKATGGMQIFIRFRRSSLAANLYSRFTYYAALVGSNTHNHVTSIYCGMFWMGNLTLQTNLVK